MKKPVLFLLGSCVSAMVFGQTEARLVFNNAGGAANHPWMVFNPDPSAANTGAYVVIENQTGTGIQSLSGSQPNIKTEAEQNRIRWVNGTGAAGQTYTIPFSTASGANIPLTVTKSTAGAATAASSMVFSTYNHSVWAGSNAGTQWQNNNFRPTDVTHMNDFVLGSVDNSENAVNRFWIIDPKQTGYAYTTSPDVMLAFNCEVANDVDASGIADVTADALLPSATPMQAQRFNSLTNKWGDYQSAPGSAYSWGAILNVNTVAASSANFFRSWTLSSSVDPLPIELTDWKGACDGNVVTLSWTTATEHGNDYFTIEKSRDASTWNVLGIVDAVGSSLSESNYSFVDQESSGIAYYRLSQTDNDGTTRTFTVVAAGCDAQNTEIVNAWDDGADLNVAVSSTDKGIYDVSLLDAQGKLMKYIASQVINEGFTTLKFNKQGIATGVYVVEFRNLDDLMTRRVMLY